MSKELEDQTKNAFDFIQKLFFEVSYLIKEVEGMLQLEEEQFVICRPSGYAVTTRTSTGLEPSNVELWLPRAFTVCFCPSDKTKMEKGQTNTPITDDLKLLVMDIALKGKQVDSPTILAGCLSNISPKKEYEKFERFMYAFSYNRGKAFSATSYEDSYVSFSAQYIKRRLFSIKDSDAVKKELVDPMIKMFRG